jgi:predicted Ser/Thr protein kinase
MTSNTNSTDDYSEEFENEADALLATQEEEPVDLNSFVNSIFADPSKVARSSQYILQAIESQGKRTVIEQGEEIDRWCFFDDPWKGGKYAILGNTRLLNDFVERLRDLSTNDGTNDKIVWITGPTATGKSELKRCLIHGLKEFSKTEEGARYTIEWNVASLSETQPSSGMTYENTDTQTDETDWYQSPVQSHPLTVFPQPVREHITEKIKTETNYNALLKPSLDPFSQEAYTTLKDHYKTETTEELFSKITSKNHLRIVRWTMDVGQGIGVLYSEASGAPDEKLFGSWMPWMLQKLDSKGRKNPQAFNYDGLVSRGNRGISIIEDASQHMDVLQNLLNITDERAARIDNSYKLNIDTVLMVISNPDLDAALNQKEEAGASDPLKALKRRFDKYQFTYLTSYGREICLLRRELLSQNHYPPKEISLSNRLELRDTEFAPHTVEAAALYSVLTRLDPVATPNELSLLDKALLYEHGYIAEGDSTKTRDDYDFEDTEFEGRNGLPVTYTLDVFRGLAFDESLVLPHEILEELVEQLDGEPMFSDKETSEFKGRVDSVKAHIIDEQVEDIQAAMLRDETVTEEQLENYIENVYSWTNGSEDADEFEMKIFETEKLGKFDDDAYSGVNPNEDVVSFREDEVMVAINKYVWAQRDGFEISEINVRETTLFNDLLTEYEWGDVQDVYENLDGSMWRNPQSGTETETVKEKTITNLVDMFDYTEDSARATARYIIENHSPL